MALIGFVDESGLHDVYALGIVIVETPLLVPARDFVRSMVPGKHQRIHFVDLNRTSQMAIASRLATGPWTTLALAARSSQRRHERARRRLLTRLPWQLAEAGIVLSSLTLESRGQALDRNDVAIRENLLNQYPSYPRMAFLRPAEEPLLWAADVVAGHASRAVASGVAPVFPCALVD